MFSWKLSWDSYKNGFGSTDGNNFWLGLERVHQLTSSAAYKLRIELQDSAASLWHSVEYWSFTVGDELTTKYVINIDGYEFWPDGIADKNEFLAATVSCIVISRIEAEQTCRRGRKSWRLHAHTDTANMCVEEFTRAFDVWRSGIHVHPCKYRLNLPVDSVMYGTP
jgi:hypothetical protein